MIFLDDVNVAEEVGESRSHPLAEFSKINTIIRKHRGSLKHKVHTLLFFGQKHIHAQLRNVKNIISQPSSNLSILIKHGPTSSLKCISTS